MSLELLINKTANEVGEWLPSSGYQGMLSIQGLTAGSVTIQIRGPQSPAAPIEIRNQAGAAINVFSIDGAYGQLSIPQGVFVRAVLASVSGNVSVVLN